MVTYSDLFEFVIMLIAFATFIYKISKKKNARKGRFFLVTGTNKSVNQVRQVAGKELNRDRKQNDAEKFSYHVEDTGTKPLFQTFGEFENDIDNQHVGSNSQ